MEEREVPPVVVREAVVGRPVVAARGEPARALVEAALHLVHVRHRVHRPRVARIELQRGLAGVERMRRRGCISSSPKACMPSTKLYSGAAATSAGSTRGDASLQVAGVAAEEVEQVRDLQGHQVLRMVDQDPLPGSRRPAATGRRRTGAWRRDGARSRSFAWPAAARSAARCRVSRPGGRSPARSSTAARWPSSGAPASSAGPRRSRRRGRRGDCRRTTACATAPSRHARSRGRARADRAAAGIDPPGPGAGPGGLAGGGDGGFIGHRRHRRSPGVVPAIGKVSGNACSLALRGQNH